MLIVIEGLDGSGKSTQVARMSEYLASRDGRSPEYLHFPRFDTPVVGDMIARFLRGEFGRIDQVHPMIVALLFAEDRRDASAMIRGWRLRMSPARWSFSGGYWIQNMVSTAFRVRT